MRLKIVWVLAVFFWATMVSVCMAGNIQTPFIPPAGKILLLVGQDRGTIAQYVKATGVVPGGTMVYTSVKGLEGLRRAVEYGSGPQDATVLLKSYPHSVIQIGLYMVNELDDIITGKYDANLKILAQWLKKANRPVYLRIGYEFDYPGNHYDPGKYKKAFRHIVNLLRKEKVHNVAYVWHSYCWTKKSEKHWMDWYPGDHYVDWFGVSLFETPDQLWVMQKFVELARKHHKPFMIAESTPWGLYTLQAKIDWFHRVFQVIKDWKVNAFCYIDSDWDKLPMYAGQRIGDARVENNPVIKKLWLKEIRQSRYLKSSKNLFKLLGWK